jgi:hypothetical protein
MAQAPKRKEETVGKEMTGDEALAYVLHELRISKTFVSPEVPDFLREKLKGNHVEMVEAPSPEGRGLFWLTLRQVEEMTWA